MNRKVFVKIACAVVLWGMLIGAVSNSFVAVLAASSAEDDTSMSTESRVERIDEYSEKLKLFMDGLTSSIIHAFSEDSYCISGEFEQGGFTATGEAENSTVYVRSVHPVMVDPSVGVNVSPTDYTIYNYVLYWYDAHMDFLSKTSARNTGYVHMPPKEARFVMFLVYRQDGAEILPTESTFLTISCEKTEQLKWLVDSKGLHAADVEKAQREQSGITLFSAGEFEQGRFNSGTSVKTQGITPMDYIRTVRPTAINNAYPLTVIPSEGYKCWIVFLDKNGDFLSQESEISTEKTYIVEENACYVICTVQASEGTKITPTDAETYVTYVQESAEASVVNQEARVTALEEGSAIVPSYFQKQLEKKIPIIIANANSIGRHGETFIFITDPHWDRNYRNSPALIKYLLSKTNINLLLCGGDMIDGGERDAMYNTMIDCVHCFQFSLADNFLPIAFGNHDNNGNYAISISDDTQRFSQDAVYACMYAQISDRVTFMTDHEFSFYFDRPTSKTRFIFLDSGENSTFTAFDELAEVLNATPSGYNIIFVEHFIYGNKQLRPTFRQVMDVIATYNSRGKITISNTYDFSNAGGKVQLILGGHTHSDVSWDVGAEGNTAGVPIIITDTDSYRDHKGTEGTVNSQCFDVVSIDYTGKTVKCTRIGRGDDREFVLK